MNENETYNRFFSDHETTQQHIQQTRKDQIHGEHVKIHTLSVLVQREIHIYRIRGNEEPIEKVMQDPILRDIYYPAGHPLRISHHLNCHCNSIINVATISNTRRSCLSL